MDTPPPPKLADLLRHPDDLDRIATLRQEFARKKAGVDDRLRVGLREQLETTQSGMTGLADGQKAVQAIRDEMAGIDRLCSESQNMIRDLTSINAVSQAHRNFAAVEAMRRDLESFNDRLAAVERMLAEDEADRDNMPSLLPCHYELTRLRNIRDDAMEQIGRADDPSLRPTLEDLFERLDDAVARFDSLVGMLAANLIGLVVEENNGLVVRLAVMLDVEDRSDQRALALREALRDHGEMAARLRGMADGGARAARGYMDRFRLAIRQAAQQQLAAARDAFLADPSRLDKALRWFFNDLNAVRVGLVPLVPRRWKILPWYGEMYHGLMRDWLAGLIEDPDTSSAHSLEMVSWPERYYAKMARLGFSQEELGPHVLDNREAELVRDFRQLIIKLLDEWLERILAQERRDLGGRSAVEGSNLEVGELGHLRTRGPVDLWRMLGEQVAAAAGSGRADVVEGVVDAMFVRLRARQATWQKMLDEEAARYEGAAAGAGAGSSASAAATAAAASQPADPDGFSPLQDWLAAVANDQIACIDDEEEDEGTRQGYLTTFRQRFAPSVSAAFLERADAEISSLRDGYLDMASWCLTRFGHLVCAVDFGPVVGDLFTPRWYNGAAIRQMMATVEEYATEYRQVLHPSLADLFGEILANEVLVRYLSAVRNRGARFRRSEPFQDKIFDDVSSALEYFNTLDRTSAETLKQTWRVTEPFLRLLTCERDGVADAFEAFKSAYWDLQISWVEAVLRARDDFERAMLNAVKARAAQMDVVRGPETIMAKVK